MKFIPDTCEAILFPVCLAEIHALEVGVFVGFLASLLYVKSPIAASLVLVAIVAASIVKKIDGKRKPWYVLGGVLAGLTVGTAIGRLLIF